MVTSIVVVGTLICYALVHLVHDLIAAQMNMQYSLIQKFMLYKFELSCNTMEATKNICCEKGRGTVNLNTITRWFKKFHTDYKNFNDQIRLG